MGCFKEDINLAFPRLLERRRNQFKLQQRPFGGILGKPLWALGGAIMEETTEWQQKILIIRKLQSR